MCANVFDGYLRVLIRDLYRILKKCVIKLSVASPVQFVPKCHDSRNL